MARALVSLAIVLILSSLGILACSENAPTSTSPPPIARDRAPSVAQATELLASLTPGSASTDAAKIASATESPAPPTVLTPSPTPVPAPRPTRTPRPTPTTAPAATAVPTETPSPTTTPVGTPEPTAVPSPTPTAVPTATPAPTATPTPAPSPTPVPTATPTPPPTPAPTATPIPPPTPAPTPAPPKPTPGTSPRVTPPPLAEAEPLVYIPSLNARVTELRFYEKEFDLNLPSDARVYKQTFSSRTTRAIGWEVHLVYPPQPEGIEYEIEYVFYRPNGTILRRAANAHIEAGWTSSWRSGLEAIDNHCNG